MNPLYPPPVKAEEEYTEYGGQSSSQYSYSAAPVPVPVPVPIEGLNDTGPPPFLIKTFDMVDDPISDGIVSWSRGGQSIVVWDAHAFSTRLLPRYFKHNNFSSFVRQLNTYGFRKIDPDRWEFANESFLQGQKHLLKNIRRRKSHSQPISSQQQQNQEASGHCVELGRFGLDVEVDQLRRDKQVLFMELMKIRQQQQATRSYLHSMELRLQGTEKKQQHMMSFLAKAMQNPEFLQQLVQQKEKRKQLEEAITKKRRRPIDQGGTTTSNEVGISFSSIKAESLEHEDGFGLNQVSELEALALEMQGFGKTNMMQQEVVNRSEFDWGFWDELLNHKVFDELKKHTGMEEEDGDVNVLADKLGFLGSSSK